jgi:hypothetical protein
MYVSAILWSSPAFHTHIYAYVYVYVCSGSMTLPRVRSHEIVRKVESVEHVYVGQSVRLEQ